MRQFHALLRRNCKLFFKDRGMFITSLITPAVLLVLYVTFLGKVYRESFTAALPAGIPIPDKLIGGMVGGELISSLLAVCCVTVSFCSNMLMVQDKITGARRDLLLTPVRRNTLATAYYAATVCSTMLVCLVAMVLGFCYLAGAGWYLQGVDILYILLDIVLLVLFGTALSSIINHFLTTQGQISAVGTVVSAGYGFLCGAYMPLSQFSIGLQRILLFLPGTYGTSLLRNHTLRGVFAQLEETGLPHAAVTQIADSVDCNLYFFGRQVSRFGMYLVLIGAVVLLLGIYTVLQRQKK